MVDILSIITIMFHLYDMFTNCERFEAPVFSIAVVLLMLCICATMLNIKNEGAVFGIAHVVLSVPCLYTAIGTFDYWRHGFRIYIDSGNVCEQLHRILVICVLSLAPMVGIFSKIHMRKSSNR